jgi:hypothetical protein
MASNGAAGGIAQAAIATLDSLSEKAEGDIIGTALSHTDWLDSLAMKEALAGVGFQPLGTENRPRHGVSGPPSQLPR